MGELHALEEAEQVILEFVYFVDEAWIEQVIDQEGHKPSAKWQVKFDLSEVQSPELRKRIRLAYRYYESSDIYPRLAAPTDDPEIFADRFDTWQNAEEAEETEKVEASEAKAKAKATENKAFDDEKIAWVKKQGSERLKVAVARGYKANRTYALERAAAEFPEFWVDTADEIDWNDRPDPSETALDMETKIREQLEELGQDKHADARIVWLTEAPAAVDDKLDETGEQFEAQEAIVISPYLGRYALSMPVDPEQRVKVEVSE